MNKIKVLCDSCSSLTKDLAIELDVEILPVEFQIGDVVYNPLDENIISFEEYYARLENKEQAKTSCINPNNYMNSFKVYLEKGYDIIYFSLSGGLSSSFNNALLAKSLLEEEYPNNVVNIVDSKSGSLGIYFYIREACKLRDEGLSCADIYEKLKNNGLKVESLFTIGSLDHLRRGGRLSAVSAVLGALLHINPIIVVNNEGKLVEHSKHRGRKKATNKLIELALANAMEGTTINIAYTNCEEEALKLKEYIETNSNFKCETGFIDFTLGAHCGPKTIAFFYRNK